MNEWEKCFRLTLEQNMKADAAHGMEHIERVAGLARAIGDQEQADLRILIPAAWLHDCVTIPKDSPHRVKASTLAANKAQEILSSLQYPSELFGAIAHAISAHSFSAHIAPLTIEAKVLQDADRLDAIGAIGIARAIQVGTECKRTLYSNEDPFCEKRKPDDSSWIIDHFYVKLLSICDSMQTESGRLEAERRKQFMLMFLKELERNI